MTDIDWRKLFILYGVHVSECEGSDFLGGFGDVLPAFSEELTEDERAEVTAIAKRRAVWVSGALD